MLMYSQERQRQLMGGVQGREDAEQRETQEISIVLAKEGTKRLAEREI